MLISTLASPGYSSLSSFRFGSAPSVSDTAWKSPEMRLIVFQVLSAELYTIDFKSSPITSILILYDVDGSSITQTHILSATIQ